MRNAAFSANVTELAFCYGNVTGKKISRNINVLSGTSTKHDTEKSIDTSSRRTETSLFIYTVQLFFKNRSIHHMLIPIYAKDFCNATINLC